MTAKDKAKELVNQMYNPILNTDLVIFTPKDASKYKVAKQCALIAVYEIILSNPHSNPFNTDVYSIVGYWQEVKQEIRKL